MTAICCYFQVHQPRRLRHYSFFDIGNNHFYEDEQLNRAIMQKVAGKCYLPATNLLLKLIKQYNGAFKCAFSLSGTFIEQCKLYAPEVLEQFRRLVNTDKVELLNETYHHSLSAIFSLEEFVRQVARHRELIQQEFGYKASTFRNTELIYHNDLAPIVAKLGYRTILAEGADKALRGQSPNHLYQAKSSPKVKMLLRNYPLTDDIAFRFSERNWKEWPVTADKFSHWIHAMEPHAEIVNLFMDFETFGEHQWEASGIFNFLNELPKKILKHPKFHFVTPNEASNHLTVRGELDVPYYLSWADERRDLSAWRGNQLQEDALQAVYSLQSEVYQTHNVDLIDTWQRLLTSDHFYYLCTKYAADGDVHKYFSPYASPYEAYVNYMNILADFKLVLNSAKTNAQNPTPLTPPAKEAPMTLNVTTAPPKSRSLDTTKQAMAKSCMLNPLEGAATHHSPLFNKLQRWFKK